MLDNYLYDHFGFRKTEENEHAVVYERWIQKFGYVQVVCIQRKDSGKHIIQSYDKNTFDEKKIGNTCVGLDIKEMIPFWLKAKWMIHKYHWNRRRSST